MDAHEARINQALKRLVEEFRIEALTPEDYRARRRAILAGWHDRDVTTAPPDERTREMPAVSAPAVAPPALGQQIWRRLPWAVIAGAVLGAGVYVLRNVL